MTGISKWQFAVSEEEDIDWEAESVKAINSWEGLMKLHVNKGRNDDSIAQGELEDENETASGEGRERSEEIFTEGNIRTCPICASEACLLRQRTGSNAEVQDKRYTARRVNSADLPRILEDQELVSSPIEERSEFSFLIESPHSSTNSKGSTWWDIDDRKSNSKDQIQPTMWSISEFISNTNSSSSSISNLEKGSLQRSSVPIKIKRQGDLPYYYFLRHEVTQIPTSVNSSLIDSQSAVTTLVNSSAISSIVSSSNSSSQTSSSVSRCMQRTTSKSEKLMQEVKKLRERQAQLQRRAEEVLGESDSDWPNFNGRFHPQFCHMLEDIRRRGPDWYVKEIGEIVKKHIAEDERERKDEEWKLEKQYGRKPAQQYWAKERKVKTW
ncbi:uncharacterized protein L201_004958 [Kwoniella dendrophila CBS 6074]|uniref:Uncharacterized protein n=1 Tax=Kwoniella dendrophila CBS 6074 TaxID=1295534 RepID=A0AAX4JZT1_9TREE